MLKHIAYMTLARRPIQRDACFSNARQALVQKNMHLHRPVSSPVETNKCHMRYANGRNSATFRHSHCREPQNFSASMRVEELNRIDKDVGEWWLPTTWSPERASPLKSCKKCADVSTNQRVGHLTSLCRVVLLARPSSVLSTFALK